MMMNERHSDLTDAPHVVSSHMCTEIQIETHTMAER